jgi:hypothetical protein
MEQNKGREENNGRYTKGQVNAQIQGQAQGQSQDEKSNLSKNKKNKKSVPQINQENEGK